MNRKINKKISQILLIVLLFNVFFLPQKTQAQVINLDRFGTSFNVSGTIDPRVVDFSDIGSDPLGAVADCVANALADSLLNMAGGLVQDFLGDIAGDFLGSFFGEGLSGLMGGGGLGGLDMGGFGTVPVNDSVVRKTTENITKINTALKEDSGKFIAKEFGDGGASLDSIAFCLVNKTIENIVDETTNWIKTGNNGGPVFVQNPQKYFGSVRDYELRKILEGLTDNLICIEIDINNLKRQLVEQYYYSFSLDIPRCPLGTIRVEFLNGDFSAGGWDAWLNYTQNPQNQYFGYLTSVESTINKNVLESEDVAKLEFEANNGYLSAKNNDGDILTPGSLIEAQIHNTYNLPTDRLATADEFDEIMNNLISNYINLSIGG